jgi:hypothetical protein
MMQTNQLYGHTVSDFRDTINQPRQAARSKRSGIKAGSAAAIRSYPSPDPPTSHPRWYSYALAIPNGTDALYVNVILTPLAKRKISPRIS